MSLESADFIPGLVETNPEGTDPKSQGDDHLRLLKHVLKSQFPNFTGEAVTKTEAQINAQLDQGDFGLGATPAAPGLRVTNADTIQASGFYNLQPPFTGGPTATYYAILHISFDTSPVQLAMPVDGTLSDLYIRSFSTTWAPWERVWTYAELVKQTASDDATTGRVMLTTAFGLGAKRGWAAIDANTIAVTQFDACLPTATNTPIADYGLLLTQASSDAGYLCQTFTQVATVGNAEATWRRRKEGGTWRPWVKSAAITAESLAATGYRVESGLVTQWGQTGTIPDDTTLGVVFPLPMSECYTVQATPIAVHVGSAFSCAGISVITATGFNLTHMSNQPSAAAFKWLAIGRLLA